MINKLKQNKLILIIFMISIILIITGVTYSLYEILFTGRKEQVIDAGGIVFKYNETSDGLILDNNSILNDTDGKSQEKYFDFEISLASNKNTSINYIIAIDENDISTLTNDKVKVYLTNQDNIEIVSPTSISQLEVDVNKNNYKKLYNKQINQGEKHLYRLRTWIDDTKDLYTETSNDGNHTLEMKDVIYKFKVNVYTVLENEETIITGADTLIKLTDNKDNSGLYTITHEADSTLQIGTNESITEYRYRGASPKNYVTFNNEVWRIIGVFPVDDGTGKIENRIKIVRDQSIGNNRWDTYDKNNWATASLKTNLNSTYLSGLTIETQSMIGNTKYYLGGYNTANIQKDVMYQYERKTSGSTYYYGTNPNSWVGKLALMYASDYGYAASDECTQNLSNYNDTTCTVYNWLYNLKDKEWLLPQSARGGSNAFYVYSNGYVGYNFDTYNNQLAVRPVIYLKYNVQISSGDGTSSNPYKFILNKNEDNSNANKPVLASNMIPVYYDETSSSWKKADINNKTMENRWYNYDNQIWANAVTITSDRLETYKNENPGTVIPMDDITTMWVWIPRFNAVTPSNYNGGTVALPNAIDVTFVKQNEIAIDAFTFGDKELSGFWYGKFETSTTDGKLGCTTTTCSNANNILIKPNLVSVTVNNVSSYFYAGRSMEQPNNSFGFVSSEVDTHMSKNNEWGAVAYLTQSIYGRCADSTTCIDIGINNNSSYKTGYGAPAGSSSSATNGAYNTTLGKAASTTNNIYGIYDMSGGRGEYVMGVYNNSKSASGFNDLPDKKYYNNYTTTEYQGHALYATKGWYYDGNDVLDTSKSWYVRGGEYNSGLSAGVFYYFTYYGSNVYYTVRYVITNE